MSTVPVKWVIVESSELLRVTAKSVNGPLSPATSLTSLVASAGVRNGLVAVMVDPPPAVGRGPSMVQPADRRSARDS